MRPQAKEANACTKFRLLMWKNFLQQWRHKGQTFLELLLPVLTMSLVLLLRSQIEPTVNSLRTYPPIQADTLNYSTRVLAGLDVMSLSVAYSPENEILEDVIRTAIGNIFLTNVQKILEDVDIPIALPESINSTLILDVARRLVAITPYRSGSDLRAIYMEEEHTKSVIAAFEFPDDLFGATSLPQELSYAIRFPERLRQNSIFGIGGRTWRTDLGFPVFDMPGPRFPFSWEGGNDPGYVNEMFIAIQHALSMELITRMTGESYSGYEVFIQRYPHPSYVADLATDALQLLFPMFIMISFSYTAINIVRAVTVEKEMQLKETMKIMGLPTWLHWTAWFCKQFIYLLVASVLILVILKINWFTTDAGFSEYAVMTNTPWTVLLFFIVLYLTCTIFFCFMLSGFFSKASTAALFAGVIWYLTYIPAFLLAVDINMSAGTQAATCLLINSAMSYGFQLMLSRESSGGLQWGDFFATPSSDTSRFVFGHVVLMMALDCVLYMLIALYMEQVRPGPYGAPKPWYFFLQRQFWCSSSTNTGSTIVPIDKEEDSNVTKEKDPTDLRVGVEISNLTKVYNNNAAVNNLSLNIYDDQITVLLGHNGAGKSTTISMLTGNLEITRGSVTVAGYDITKQVRHARAHIGLCPQHNVLFSELTVREHLKFFATLKGYKGKELNEEIDSLITKLELDEKRDYQSSGLSGGQKRRLAVGIALCGSARVVLLDEPTSGMDPASRRGLWDLLQKEKKGRSMILTTHFMDEADILGDRVAIMANGRLQCVGSPYFLKSHYGVGYTLVVVKNRDFNTDMCTELINRHIPGTAVKHDRGSEVAYNLKDESAHLFEAMLKDLEDNVENIHIKNYGLVATTLEDVFMSVGSDVVPTNLDDSATGTESTCGDTLTAYELDASLENLDDTRETKVTGVRLLWEHVTAVWLKLWLVWTRSWQLLVLQVLVPILQINVTLGLLHYIVSLSDSIVKRELSLAEGFASTETLVTYNGSVPSSLGQRAQAAYESMFRGAAAAAGMGLTAVQEPLLENYYLNRTADPREMSQARHSLLIGATFDDTRATAWFSNFGYHDVAISLAAVHEALLKVFRPNASITVYNHPIEANYANQNNMQMMVQMLSMQLASGVGTSLSLISAVFIMFYIKERTSRAKLLQKAAGIRPAVLWGSAAVFDWLWFCLIAVTMVISCAAFQVIGLSTAAELGRFYVLIMVYGAAMLPINYVCSYLFKGPSVGFVSIFFLNVLLGMMGAQIVEALAAPALDTQHVADVLDSVFQFFPLYSLVTAVRLLNQVGLVEWSCLQTCEFLSAVTPGGRECTMASMCQSLEHCCVREDPWFDWAYPGTLRYIVFMLVSGTVFWVLLMVAEYRLLQKIFNFSRQPPPLQEDSLDPDVLDEMKHAELAGKGSPEHSLVAQRLTKYYGKNLAVDQVSFSVGDTECFGLLGVNGAGKTTTFKMLMGDETISSGDAFVSGDSVKKNITKVHENIGYCPQFDAVFGELTGRETLRLFCKLRGLPPAAARAQPAALAQALGFHKHLDKKVDQYSGGNKRKLSTAVALLGRTRLVFVDEPTTGVDPAAKRQVWSAVRSAQRAGRGVVLTSHSMEECEALCSRLTIMVNGRFQCLGAPQHLKNKFSQGFTMTIKMRVDETNIVSPEAMEAIKNYVRSNFKDPKIMEEYQGVITYYLPDRSLPWSRMFGLMEHARAYLEVEDYRISQTTLEQIFLQFTKYQREVEQT